MNRSFLHSAKLATLAMMVAAGSCVSASSSDEAVAPKEKISLFNGRDYSNWTFFLANDANPTNTFSIRDGVIHCTGRPAGYLRTERAYRDYKLTVEWRFRKAGNTGVLLHINGPDKVWPRSIEAQGQSGHQGDFWVIDGTTFKEHGGKEDRHVPKRGESNEKPVGEWNLYEIVCRGDSIRVYVNGKLMNEATGCNVTAGRIGIQSEGSELEIRRIELEPAP